MRAEPTTSSPSSTSQILIQQLQKSLDSCSLAVEDGDFRQSEAVISEIVDTLTLISNDALFNQDDDDDDDCVEEARINSIDVLSHLLSYLSNPCLKQAVIDALSFELPKAVAKFAGVSHRCYVIVESIIDLFLTKCNPRDMLSVFCEALNSYGKTTDAPGYVASLLHGVSKVFLCIQRRHFEQIKVAVPVILNALNAASFDLDGEDDIGLKKLFEGAIGIANSIQATCKNLEGEANEKLRGILGLYVLQIMTVVSVSIGKEVPTCLFFVQQLSSFFLYCNLSYTYLIVGERVDPLISLVYGENTDDYMDCFSYVKQGGVLSVIWGHISEEVSLAAGQDLNILKDELKSTQIRRWSAIGMMQLIFYLGELPWVLKKHALDFLFAITENVKEQEMNEDLICSSLTSRLIGTLQAILLAVMNAPSAELRKMAFCASKRILDDIPAYLRLDIILVLVKSLESPSMTALVFDSARENLRNDYLKLKEAKISLTNSLWDTGILELVEFVLKPSRGPPSLPGESDAVSSALNLYRYVLITESTGKTNYTGVLSRSNLLKAYNEWLLPLRTLVMSIMAETKKDSEQLSFDIICGLNPVEFVLHRCIELVEEKIKQSS